MSSHFSASMADLCRGCLQQHNMAAIPERAAAAAWTRSLIPSIRASVCPQCRRTFSTRPALLAGHNKWSKIRHGNGVADAKKQTDNQDFAKTLTLYSKCGLPQPQ